MGNKLINSKCCYKKLNSFYTIISDLWPNLEWFANYSLLLLPDPNWVYQTRIDEGQEGKNKNPALFQGQLTEALQKYTNINSESVEGWTLPGIYFIQQTTPDIGRKLQKLALGPQTPTEKLVEITFTVFNNQNRAEEDLKATTWWKQKAHLSAIALSPMPPQGHPSPRLPLT